MESSNHSKNSPDQREGCCDQSTPEIDPNQSNVESESIRADESFSSPHLQRNSHSDSGKLSSLTSSSSGGESDNLCSNSNDEKLSQGDIKKESTNVFEESVSLDSGYSHQTKFLDIIPKIARRMLLAEHEQFTTDAKRDFEIAQREKQSLMIQQSRDRQDVLNLVNLRHRSVVGGPSLSSNRGSDLNTSIHNLHFIVDDSTIRQPYNPNDINQQDFEYAVHQEQQRSGGGSSSGTSSGTALGSRGSGININHNKRQHDGTPISIVHFHEPDILRSCVYVKFVKLYKSLFNQHDSNELMNSLYYPCCNIDMVNLRKFWIRIPLPPPNMTNGNDYMGTSVPRMTVQMIHCTQIVGLPNVRDNMKIDFMTHPDCILQIQETRVFHSRDGCVRSASRFIFTATKITYHQPTTQPSQSDGVSSTERSVPILSTVSEDDHDDNHSITSRTRMACQSIPNGSGTTSSDSGSGDTMSGDASHASVTMEEVNMEGYFMVYYDKFNRVSQVETNIFKSL